MYAIVWSETRRAGVVAARMEGKQLANTVLPVLPSVCAHSGHQLNLLRQNRARKLKQDLQNIWLPRQSCRRDNTPLKDSAQCSLPCLTSRTEASAHHADQSMQDQSSTNIMAPNHLWGECQWAKADLQQPLRIFKICTGCTNCRPNFWPDLDIKKRDGLHLSRPVVRTSWTALTRVHMPPKCCLIRSHPSHS